MLEVQDAQTTTPLSPRHLTSSQLTAKVALLECDLKEQSRQRDKAEDELRSANRNARKAEDDRHRAENDRVATAMEGEKWRLKAEEGGKREEKLRVEVQLLKREVEEGKGFGEEASTLREKFKTTVEEKDGTISELKAEVAAIREKANKRMGQLKNAFEDTATRGAKDKAKLDAVMKASREAAKIITAQKEEIRKLRAHALEREEEDRKKTEEVSKYKMELSNLQGVVGEIQQKQEKLTTAIKVKDVTIQEQNGEVKRQRSIIDKQNEGSKQMQDDLARIREERGDLEEELEGKREEYEDLEDRMKDLEVETERLRVEAESKGRGEGEASRILREEIEAENADLKEILLSKEEALGRMEDELTKARARYEEVRMGL